MWLASVAALSGCTSGPQAAAPAPPPGAPRLRSSAVLTILTPTTGTVISGPTVHVRLKLVGGEIVPQTSTHITPDTGHVHLSVDGTVVSMLYGLNQDVTVHPGFHLLQAEFVATDHFPFNPRVIRAVTITVK